MGRLFDMMVGSILFAFLFLLSFIGVVGRIQSALLFNIKFANSLKRGRLLVRLLCIYLDNQRREDESLHRISNQNKYVSRRSRAHICL